MYIRVKAVPGAKREKVTKIASNRYEIHVQEKAERNLANKKITRIIGLLFKVPISKVRMVSGHQSSTKMFSVDVE